MSESSLDLIVVEAEHVTEVAADRVEVWIDVCGTSFFSGTAALERMEEVRDVVAQMTSSGIQAEDIVLQDAVAQVKTGVFSKSSKATYTIRALCRNLDNLADLLTRATQPKHAGLNRLVWKFPASEQTVQSCLAAAIESAAARAEVIAGALRVTRGMVHRLKFDVIDTPFDIDYIGEFDHRKRSNEFFDLSDPRAGNLSVMRMKRMGVRVSVEYRVGDAHSHQNQDAPA